MKRKQKLIGLILCLALVIAACGKQIVENGANVVATQTAAVKNERQCNLDVLQPLAYSNVDGLELEPGTYISIIGREAGGPYWKAIEEGAQQAIADINKKMGYKGEDKVRLTYSGPNTRDSVDEQVNILDEELARYPAAVGISIVDSKACEVQFDLAAENGIPIVAFDSGSDYPGLMSTVSTDNQEAAKTAASKLAQAIDEKGEVILFIHDIGTIAAKEREAAFKKEIQDKYPNVSVAATYYMDSPKLMQKEIAKEKKLKEDEVTQEMIFQYIIEQHPNLKGCFATDEETTQLVLSASDALKKTDLEIVGFDGGTKQLEALAADKLTGLIIQNPYGMGYATVIATARAILSQGNEAQVDSGYVWATKENMENETIKRMLY